MISSGISPSEGQPVWSSILMPSEPRPFRYAEGSMRLSVRSRSVGCLNRSRAAVSHGRRPGLRPGLRWRWGESNPRPTRFQRRHLRAQPTASFRNPGDAVGSFSWALVRIVLAHRSQRPGESILHCYARFRRDRHPPGGHAALIRQRMHNFRYWHLCLFPTL